MNKTKEKIRVSDIITEEEISKWKNGDIITISAGTGSGKSYFIKNVLYDYAKQRNQKILMLIHRTNCVNQFLKEINRDDKTDFIDIFTYQKIEHSNLYQNEGIDLNKYKYIVSDEFHYFISDAGFNNTTDVSYNKIMDQNDAIKIFMSATGESIKRYINNISKIETIDYEIPMGFSFIKSLTFFNKNDTLKELIRESISNNQKSIFFIQSAEKAYKLYKEFKRYCLFNCSKNNASYYKYVDINKIDEMLEKERFEELVLITTSCLDAGVNLIDRELRNIVIDIKDMGSLIQCIGRKRIQDENDFINVYIKTINNQQLGGLQTVTRKQVKMADYLLKHGTQAFLSRYPRKFDNSKIIYDEFKSDSDRDNTCIKKVNFLMYLKKKLDLGEYALMQQLGEFGYCKELARMLGFHDADSDKYKYNTLNENYSLNKYLENHVGQVMLQVKDRKELIDKINLRSNGKQLKNINTLNQALQEQELNYKIVKFQTSKIINGIKKKYKNSWRIEKIIPK